MEDTPKIPEADFRDMRNWPLPNNGSEEPITPVAPAINRSARLQGLLNNWRGPDGSPLHPSLAGQFSSLPIKTGKASSGEAAQRIPDYTKRTLPLDIILILRDRIIESTANLQHRWKHFDREDRSLLAGNYTNLFDMFLFHQKAMLSFSGRTEALVEANVLDAQMREYPCLQLDNNALLMRSVIEWGKLAATTFMIGHFLMFTMRGVVCDTDADFVRLSTIQHYYRDALHDLSTIAVQRNTGENALFAACRVEEALPGMERMLSHGIVEIGEVLGRYI